MHKSEGENQVKTKTEDTTSPIETEKGLYLLNFYVHLIFL